MSWKPHVNCGKLITIQERCSLGGSVVWVDGATAATRQRLPASSQYMGEHMKELIISCDNTMGIPGAEIDDGLALLYLLGRPDVHVRAICCTHGNASTAETYQATVALCQRMGLSDVPVLRGADAGTTLDQPSDAARYLAAEARRQPGALSLLSLGATTDLAAAERLDPGTLGRFHEIALMGGMTRTLCVGGRIMDELNFSVDGQATYEVLGTAHASRSFGLSTESSHLLIADAHHCLGVAFSTMEFRSRLIDCMPAAASARLLDEFCIPWMERAKREWHVDGFVGWDVLAAVALAQPELVQQLSCRVALNRRFIGSGFLDTSRQTNLSDALAASVRLVAPVDAASVCEHVYDAWYQASRAISRNLATD